MDSDFKSIHGKTQVAQKHSYVDELVEGKTVTATAFSSYLGSLKDLSIANVLQSYCNMDGTTIIL